MHSSFCKYLARSVALAFFFLGYVTSVFADDVNLAWNPNPEPTLTGYKLHYGMSPRSYGAFINVGNVTNYRVTGLGSGNYYFAITAYDSAGHESGFSNETSTVTSGCDVNGDGGHDVLDLQTVINAILVGSNSAGFDINRDSTVNALDLQTLGNVVLGVSSCP
jgi:dockerin type I repeat protein